MNAFVNPHRAKAQRQAFELLQTRTAETRGWWRFEGTSMVDCVLMAPQLVLTIGGKRTELLSAATDWYPERSQLVRNLEAAKQLASGRSWGTMISSEVPPLHGNDLGLRTLLPLERAASRYAGREELRAHYSAISFEAGL